MIARALIFAILFTAAWKALEYVVSTYGAIILSTLLSLSLVYLLGRFVGPKLPVFLGGDPPPPQPLAPDLEWDLYVAMLTSNLDEARRCLARGANPYKPFPANRRPSTTDASSCFEYAQLNGQEEMIELFAATDMAPNNSFTPNPLSGSP